MLKPGMTVEARTDPNTETWKRALVEAVELHTEKPRTLHVRVRWEDDKSVSLVPMTDEFTRFLPSDGLTGIEAIEARAQTLARTLDDKMPDGWGFALLMFQFGPGGALSWISSAARDDTARMLVELLQKWESEGSQALFPIRAHQQQKVAVLVEAMLVHLGIEAVEVPDRILATVKGELKIFDDPTRHSVVVARARKGPTLLGPNGLPIR